MSAMPDRPAVLIVDHLPLRALGLVTILDRMCGPNRCRVAQTTEEARRWVDARSPLSMVIYNAAGASLADRRHAMRLKALRARVAGTPLVDASHCACDEPGRSGGGAAGGGRRKLRKLR